MDSRLKSVGSGRRIPEKPSTKNQAGPKGFGGAADAKISMREHDHLPPGRRPTQARKNPGSRQVPKDRIRQRASISNPNAIIHA